MCLMVHPLFLGTDFTDYTVSSPNVFVVVPTDAITRTFHGLSVSSN